MLLTHTARWVFWGMICVLFVDVCVASPDEKMQTNPISALSAVLTHDRELLDHARILFQEQQTAESLQILEQLMDTMADSPLLDEAYFLYAHVLRDNGDRVHATIVLEQLIEEFPLSALVADARLVLGGLFMELIQYDKAAIVLKAAVEQSTNLTIRQKALESLRQLSTLSLNPLDVIATIVDNMVFVEDPQRTELRNEIQTLILQRLDRRALQHVTERFPVGFPGGLAFIRLIELYMAADDEVMAERVIRIFLRQFPLHPYAQTATALLHALMAKVKARDAVITAVLPFDGPLKPFGVDSFNGLQLALEEGKTLLGPDRVGLVVHESSIAESAEFRRDFSHMLDEFRPITVVGPLLTRDIRLVADLAEAAQVPLITPSATLSDVRQFGRFVFSTALTPSIQVDQIVQHAMEVLGFRRFCTLFPETATGRDFNQAFQQSVIARGGEIIAAESYPRGNMEFEIPITRLKTQDLGLYGELAVLRATRPVMNRERCIFLGLMRFFYLVKRWRLPLSPHNWHSMT